MNWVPSGGLPNTSSVEGRSLMPASAASFDWSISDEELDALAGDIGLDAGDRFRHRHRALDADDAVVAVGACGGGDGKRSARPAAARRRNSQGGSSNELSSEISCWWTHAVRMPSTDRMKRPAGQYEMRTRSQLDSAGYRARFDTRRLSNRLGNGISKAEQSGLRWSQRPIGGRHLSFILRNPHDHPVQDPHCRRCFCGDCNFGLLAGSHGIQFGHGHMSMSDPEKCPA